MEFFFTSFGTIQSVWYIYNACKSFYGKLFCGSILFQEPRSVYVIFENKIRCENEKRKRTISMVESKPKTKFHLCAFVSPLGFYAFIFSEYTNYTYNIFNENTYHECRLLMEPIIDVCVCVFPHAFNWQKEPTAKKVNIQSKCKSKSKSKCLKRERSKKMKRFECEWEWFSKWNQFFLFKLRFGIFVRYQRRIHAFQFKAVAIFIELERFLMSNKTKANIYEVPLNANKFICFSWLQFFFEPFSGTIFQILQRNQFEFKISMNNQFVSFPNKNAQKWLEFDRTARYNNKNHSIILDYDLLFLQRLCVDVVFATGDAFRTTRRASVLSIQLSKFQDTAFRDLLLWSSFRIV